MQPANICITSSYSAIQEGFFDLIANLPGGNSQYSRRWLHPKQQNSSFQGGKAQALNFNENDLRFSPTSQGFRSTARM
jgi:hypothetical protein